MHRCAIAALAAIVCAAALAANAATPGLYRSKSVIAAFKRANPCPANGLTRGACPGYQIDHREALICGGADTLANLQWLDIARHKAKTRDEVKLCRSHISPSAEAMLDT